MRILVVSDSHGHTGALDNALHRWPFDAAVFLGDGLRDWQEATARLPASKELRCVRGNCDWGALDAVDACTADYGGVRVFYTHGHLYGVKADLERAMAAAREKQAQVLLYGHTHTPRAFYKDGLHVLCPGSIAKGEYGTLEITPQGIFTALCRL